MYESLCPHTVLRRASCCFRDYIYVCVSVRIKRSWKKWEIAFVVVRGMVLGLINLMLDEEKWDT